MGNGNLFLAHFESTNRSTSGAGEIIDGSWTISLVLDISTAKIDPHNLRITVS